MTTTAIQEARERLEALLERLRASESGPDLNRDLAALFGLGPCDDRTRDPWPYTTSADAALALVERVLPGWRVALGIIPGQGASAVFTAPPWITTHDDPEHAPTAPLAILLALLTALQAQQEEGR